MKSEFVLDEFWQEQVFPCRRKVAAPSSMVWVLADKD